VLNLNLAAGNTLTMHEAIPFGDLTPYLSANVNQDLGSGKNFTDFSLTPGGPLFRRLAYLFHYWSHRTCNKS